MNELPNVDVCWCLLKLPQMATCYLARPEVGAKNVWDSRIWAGVIQPRQTSRSTRSTRYQGLRAARALLERIEVATPTAQAHQFGPSWQWGISINACQFGHPSTPKPSRDIGHLNLNSVKDSAFVGDVADRTILYFIRMSSQSIGISINQAGFIFIGIFIGWDR